MILKPATSIVVFKRYKLCSPPPNCTRGIEWNFLFYFSGYMFKGWNSKNLWSTRYYELKSVAVAGLFSIQHFPCFVFVFVFFISCLLHFIKNNTSVVQFQLMQGVSTSLYCYIYFFHFRMKSNTNWAVAVCHGTYQGIKKQFL